MNISLSCGVGPARCSEKGILPLLLSPLRGGCGGVLGGWCWWWWVCGCVGWLVLVLSVGDPGFFSFSIPSSDERVG